MKNELLEAVAEWERQRSNLDDRIRIGHELLDVLDPLPADMLATLPGADLALGDETVTLVGNVTKPKPSPKGKKKAKTPLVCLECGDTFTVPQKLGAHRRYKHPAPERPKLTSATPSDGLPHISADPTIVGKVFACDECEHEEPNIRLLRRHTYAKHDRALLRSDERVPVEPIAIAS